MDKTLASLKQNLVLALRSVPSDKNFDEVYQDLIRLNKKISLIESKNQKKRERKVDGVFQNWSFQNGSLINPNYKNNMGADALQAIDDLIQKEQKNLEDLKNKLKLQPVDYDNDSETLLG